MTQEERINMLSNIAKGLSKIMGSDTEVAVHDLQEMKLSYVANGYVTGRKAGCPLDEAWANPSRNCPMRTIIWWDLKAIPEKERS